VIDFCFLVRATPGETLDPGLPGRMMAAHGIVLPLVGVVFGYWIWFKGSCGGVVCISLVRDVDSWWRGAIGF
jgi:hypothetical protein